MIIFYIRAWTLKYQNLWLDYVRFRCFPMTVRESESTTKMGRCITVTFLTTSHQFICLFASVNKNKQKKTLTNSCASFLVFIVQTIQIFCCWSKIWSPRHSQLGKAQQRYLTNAWVNKWHCVFFVKLPEKLRYFMQYLTGQGTYILIRYNWAQICVQY